VPPRWVVILLVVYTVVGLVSVIVPHLFHARTP